MVRLGDSVWVIRIHDKNTRKILYVKENFFDGNVLAFEHEEDALRASIPISKITDKTFGIQLSPHKYEGDTRQVNFRKVSAKNLDSCVEFVISAIS